MTNYSHADTSLVASALGGLVRVGAQQGSVGE